MNALRQEILPPSGVEHAVSLNLTPSTRRLHADPSSSSSSPALGVVTNVVVARQNLLRVFEVRVEAAPLPSQAQVLADEQGKARRGTEAVEGEVEMDTGGEGFVSVGAVKVVVTAPIYKFLCIHNQTDPAASLLANSQDKALEQSRNSILSASTIFMEP